MIEIAVLGHGTVGSGVVDVLHHNSISINKKAGEQISIKKILDLRDFPDSPYADKFTKDFNEILNDEDIKIVVECMGGLTPAYEFVKSSLENGKSVVTSNKELVATHGYELLRIARDNNLNFLFEASVGGGIPIIRPISQCLAANEITEIIGILNGTTNFILTKMINEGMSFNDALKLAQELGYAERNPEADVEGHDACRKICILASLAYGKHVSPSKVYTEGITRLTEKDTEYAEKWGGVIKLIARADKLDNGNLNCVVYPCILPKFHQMASVGDVFNAIMVRGDAIGDVMFYGRGAGKLPTASAVVADIIDSVKHVNARKYLYWGHEREEYVVDHLDCQTEVFVRATTTDYSKAVEQIKAKLNVVTEISEKGEDIAVIISGVEREVRDTLSQIDLIKIENIIHVID